MSAHRSTTTGPTVIRWKYSFRDGMKWQLWENMLMMVACATFIAVGGVIVGIDWWWVVITLFVVEAAAFLAWGNVWIFRHFAQRVWVDDHGIEAQPFYGPRLRFSWDDITVRQEYERHDTIRMRVFPQMRLIGRDPSAWIVLDGEIEDSERLFDIVRSKTANASPGPERTWWQRTVYPG